MVVLCRPFDRPRDRLVVMGTACSLLQCNMFGGGGGCKVRMQAESAKLDEQELALRMGQQACWHLLFDK